MVVLWNRKRLYYTASASQKAHVQAILYQYRIPFTIRNKNKGLSSGYIFYVRKQDYMQASFLMRKLT
ncbi:MAG: hypothetical protein E7256_00165 [Lachnospiraceae bacterium]|nr:hypothetical protein [Lachnospiraceae bacterium]